MPSMPWPTDIFSRGGVLDIKVIGPYDIVFVTVTGVLSTAAGIFAFYFIGTGTEGFPLLALTIRTIICALGVLLICAGIIYRREKEFNSELFYTRQLLDSREKLKNDVEEREEAIRRQAHDFKHMVDVVLAERKAGSFGGYIPKIDTGNGVLDVILMAKYDICEKNGIHFSYIADGTGLGYMSTADICLLFGNALDNAIECEMKIADHDKRFVKLLVSEKNGWISVSLENYIEQAPVSDGEDFRTSKPDESEHGYGLRSIKKTAEKYGGAAKAVVSAEVFRLCVLLPVTPD